MLLGPLAALALAAAPSARAAGARVEVVPELGNLGTAPSASAAVGAATLQLSPNALIPALNVASAGLGAPALTPAHAFTPPAPSALVPAKAAVAAQPVAAEGRPLLIKTLAAPALDVSKLGTGDSSGAAEKDFNARAQLDAPAALSEGVFSAASSEGAPIKNRHLTLVHSAKAPAKGAAEAAAVEGAPLDLVATPESLRGLAERGESRVLIQNAQGRWLLAPRDGGNSAYPTPAELAASAGKGGRFFIVSKAGLVEWNSSVPKDAVAALGAGALGLAAKIPVLYPFVLSRLEVAHRRASWDRVLADGIGAGEAPLNAQAVVDKVIPPLIAAEFPVIAAKLGRKVDAAYAADVLKRSNGYRLYWHSASTYEDHPDNIGIPDGHFNRKFGIRLMVKPDWRKLKDFSANFRPLYAHEYTHWLQDEGFVSNKYGAEIPAVAVEVLRGIELIGLDAVMAGRAGTLHPGVMSTFEGGRHWARGDRSSEVNFYYKGALAGAAYEAGVVTGRPEAAWEFLNLVIAGKDALSPRDAWTRVVGR